VTLPALRDYARSAGALRLGRCSNSPPQFGQSCFICAEHPAQNVHSYEQMYASSSIRSVRLHFSHASLISSAMLLLARVARSK
jgi:hypothetical protein